MKQVLLISLLIFFASCQKTMQEKRIKSWVGTWEIQEIESAEPNGFSESNPFGTIEIGKTGLSKMYVQNLDYSDVDMGLEIEFYLNPLVVKNSLRLNGMLIVDTNPGYESMKSILPCEDNTVDVFAEEAAFSNRTCVWRFSNYPACIFTNNMDITSYFKWHLKKIK